MFRGDGRRPCSRRLWRSWAAMVRALAGGGCVSGDDGAAADGGSSDIKGEDSGLS